MLTPFHLPHLLNTRYNVIFKQKMTIIIAHYRFQNATIYFIENLTIRFTWPSHICMHCKKSHVGIRRIPMWTTVAQNQRTWEKEFFEPHVVWCAPHLSTSEFRAAFFNSVWSRPVIYTATCFLQCWWLLSKSGLFNNDTFRPSSAGATVPLKYKHQNVFIILRAIAYL